MAKTIEQLKAQGAEVKNATVVGENTATRVGTLFNDIVEHVGEYEVRQTADTKANTQAIAKRGIYDVSAHNNGAVFESLSDLLNNANLSTLIPESVRCGGMSIRFIQGSEPNSDNKYVQYRLMVKNWSTAIRDWQGIDTIIEKSYLGVNLVYGFEQQTLDYDVVYINNSNVEFAGNIEVGDTIQFATTQYRKVLRINISDLFGFVTTTHASDSLAFVITDINDKILYTQTGASNDYDFPGFVNISIFKEAYYLYIKCWPQDNPVVTLHEDTPFSSPIFKRTCNELDGNPTIIDYYSALYFALSADNVVGDKIKFRQNGYSVVGKLDIDGRTDKIHFDKLMSQSGTTIWVVTDDKNNVLDIGNVSTGSTNFPCDILLGKYSKRAKYLYFNFGTGSSNIPTITSLGTDLTNEELPIYVAYQNYKFKAGLAVGNTFDVESTPYLRVFGIDVFDQKGQITIESTVNSDAGRYAIVVDKDEKILGIITATGTGGEFYATTFVDLDKYPNSYKVYFSAHPNTTYFPYPTATLTNKSIKSKIYDSHLSNNVATLLLHFDGVEGIDNYMSYRKSILDEYGFKASFVIAPSCFVDGDFSKAWITNDLKTQYWDLIKDGWDVMLYPATISTTYDEQGWKDWMAATLSGLAAKGIFNITCWAAGNLEINDDVLNACKANHFKILRGGKGTYPYNVDNWYMPQIPNSENNPIINKAVFVNSQSKLNYVKTYIDYLCASKTAGSLFTHQVLETTSDTNNIDTALFRQILDYIKTKVDSGELIIKTFSEYYASVNPSDGMEWNYNRLLKMQLFNNQ